MLFSLKSRLQKEWIFCAIIEAKFMMESIDIANIHVIVVIGLAVIGAGFAQESGRDYRKNSLR